jgi:hypothetical protein
MKQTVSFHPVDPGFFETVVAPLVAGRKINPESFLLEALDARGHATRARRAPIALETIQEESRYREAPADASLWEKVRSKMERIDHRTSDLAKRVNQVVEVELHLHGRPYFVTEGSADHVADVVDEYRWAPRPDAIDTLSRAQLEKLDKGFGASVHLADEPGLSPEISFRAELMADMKAIHDLARAARERAAWPSESGESRPAVEILAGELPWRALGLHARIVPFWQARDMVGLEALCRAGGVPSPDALVPPLVLFSEAGEMFPALKEALRAELDGPRCVGGFVSPQDIPGLLEFLGSQGSRIIGAATRQGEGPACSLLLKKMRECATYAQRHQLGYLEAAGIPTPYPA